MGRLRRHGATDHRGRDEAVPGRGRLAGEHELRAGYVDAENVPVTDEVTQAQVYAQIVRRARCDPDVAEVNVFGFYDDRDRRGFQAALHRADGTPRPAADAVRAALRDTAPWSATRRGRPPPGRRSARAGGRRGRPGRSRHPAGRRGRARARVRLPGSDSAATASRLPARAGGRAAVCASGKAAPGRPVPRRARAATIAPAWRHLGLRLRAESNRRARASYGHRFR